MKKIIATSILAATASIAFAQNYTGISLYDDSFQVFNDTVAVTADSPDYEVLFGTYSSGTGIFTPFLGSAHVPENDGYLGNPFGVLEISATVSLANNNVLAAGLPFAVAITMIPDGGNYVAGSEIVLTDPSWLMPSIDAFAADALYISFTSSTTAQKGLFTFSAAGNDQLNFVAVPEPSSFGALAGFAVLGLAASRRRRS